MDKPPAAPFTCAELVAELTAIIPHCVTANISYVKGLLADLAGRVEKAGVVNMHPVSFGHTIRGDAAQFGVPDQQGDVLTKEAKEAFDRMHTTGRIRTVPPVVLGRPMRVGKLPDGRLYQTTHHRIFYPHAGDTWEIYTVPEGETEFPAPRATGEGVRFS